MKKIMAMMLGLGLILGTTAFAEDAATKATKEKKTKATKEKKAKKTKDTTATGK